VRLILEFLKKGFGATTRMSFQMHEEALLSHDSAEVNHGKIQAELFTLDKSRLKTHPSFHNEWEKGRQTNIHTAIFNLVTTIIGGGVLSLPYAIKRSGIVMGLLLLVVAAVACDWSLYILMSCARRTGSHSHSHSHSHWCSCLHFVLLNF
jgi:hypothetical protein